MSQKRYAYLIGANGPQTDHLATLEYAEKDAQRLATALLAPHCGFTEARATIAESPQPTLAGLNRFMKQCEAEDLLLIHFSGHGNYEGQLFLVCNGTDIDDCISSAIKVDDIKSYLDKCKARHKVLILDCCHAGGAYTGLFKGDRGIQSTLQQAFGSSCVILSACSRTKTTRELEGLDDSKGAGFLSWALTAACTSRFLEVSQGNEALSLMDIWQWMPTALEEANGSLKPGEEKLHLPILVNEMTPGHDGEIWLTEQRRIYTNKFISDDELTRKKYLESVSKRYSSVTLPLGPAEGFSLHAVFQPLELRRDPLAAEDLDRKKRRLLLGEQPEDEKDANRFHSQRDEKGRAEEKLQPVIAENGEDALTKSPQHRLVVLGGPGTGKTTTLKHFVGCRAKEALTDPNAPIPIFLSLADLARSQKTLQSYLVDLVEELAIERTYAEMLWKAIDTGQAFICLDSLDEVESRDQRRQKMIEWVNAWAAESGNTWVIGSRFTEYKGGSFKHGQFAEWELLPMNHQLRLELAEHLLPELQRLLEIMPAKLLSPTTFVKLVEDHPRASAWGENPLLFSLAAVVFLRTEGLPSSRAMLYHEVINAVLETREKDPMQRKVLCRVISDLALELYKTKGRAFNLDELLAPLPMIRLRHHENWQTREMAHCIVASGILDELASETYGFRHQTFQEYLAAVELALRLTHQNQGVREEAWKFAWGKRTYSRWTEVLRLMVGVLSQQPGNKGKAEAQRWLQELVKQRSTEEGDPGDLGLALALKSLTEIAEGDDQGKFTTVQLGQKIVSAWLDELLQAVRDQRYTKQLRLQSLAKDTLHLHGWGVDQTLRPLIAALWDRNTRNIACEVLEELGQQVPIEALLEALHDKDGGVRAAAVEALKGQGDRVSIELLLEALHDKDGGVRAAAVEALKGQGDRISIELLLEALHDKDGGVRAAAVEALKGQGDRISIELLLEALHDGNWSVRNAAVEVLKEQGERVPLEPLLAALHDNNEHVREIAVKVLGEQVGRVPLEPLLAALHDENWFVRQTAFEALGKQRERTPLEPLLAALHDNNEYIRVIAIKALGEQGERIPLEPLLEALHDGDWSVRQAAIETLGEQEKRMPINIIIEALKDKNENVRKSTVEILGKRGDRVPFNIIIEALKDKNENVRKAAARALGARGEIMPLDVLLAALHNDHGKVHQAAVQVLGALGKCVPLEALLAALHDEDWYIDRISFSPRFRSSSSQRKHVPLPLARLVINVIQVCYDKWSYNESNLGEACTLLYLEPLLTALHDWNEYRRTVAVEVLIALRERVPLELLLAALHDEDSNVREAIVQILGEQGERVPFESLLAVLHDEDWDVRNAVVEVLKKQGERVPLESLLAALHDEDSNVREAVVQVLGEQGERAPLESLLAVLHDEDSNVREAVVQVLGEQGERAPLESLLEALYDEDSNVREAVVQVLKKQSERVPFEPLLAALYDENGGVRLAAMQVLKSQEKHIPLENFLEALGDEDRNVGCEAVEILNNVAPDALADVTNEAIAILNGQPFGLILGSIAQTSFCKLAGELKLALPAIFDELTELLSWPHWQVRTNAARALGSIRRNVPDVAIRRLLELRRSDSVRVVREATDDALAEILSLETGIEDD